MAFFNPTADVYSTGPFRGEDNGVRDALLRRAGQATTQSPPTYDVNPLTGQATPAGATNPTNQLAQAAATTAPPAAQTALPTTQTASPAAQTGVPVQGAPDRTSPQPTQARYFTDPNLNPVQLGRPQASQTELSQFIAANQLAGDPTADAEIQRAQQVRAAAATLQDDPRFQFAQQTATVPTEFTESPGYQFAIEQAQREVERRQSAGGAFGGRAILEAQRRAQGEAFGEYYNYLGARRADLARQDAAAAAYQGLRTFDISRGDVAQQNYNVRRAQDLARQEQAILQNLGAREFDIRRGDQAYYNRLNLLAQASGLGTGVAQAVGASQQAAAGVTGALGQQGSTLAGLYAQQGQNLANIALGTGANLASTAQAGISNALTANLLAQQQSAFNPGLAAAASGGGVF